MSGLTDAFRIPHTSNVLSLATPSPPHRRPDIQRQSCFWVEHFAILKCRSRIEYGMSNNLNSFGCMIPIPQNVFHHDIISVVSVSSHIKEFWLPLVKTCQNELPGTPPPRFPGLVSDFRYGAKIKSRAGNRKLQSNTSLESAEIDLFTIFRWFWSRKCATKNVPRKMFAAKMGSRIPS